MVRVVRVSRVLCLALLFGCGGEATETTDPPPPDGGTVCAPGCDGRSCGPDGCGGTCGSCEANQTCSNGQCACVPQCDGTSCGPDGCGGSCGSCEANETCSSGQCVCVPQCNGKTCGPDGCGGTCGTCPSNSTCGSDQTGCFCDAGHVPNQQRTACIQIGGPCSSVSEAGYCSGDTWVRCDPVKGVVAMACGAGSCKTVTPDGAGACRCGSIPRDGLCAAPDGSTGKQVLFSCLPGYDILTAQNCVAETGRPTGFCSSVVTSSGPVSACYCAACRVDRGNYCSSPCSGGYSVCDYDSSTNTHTCL